MSKYNFFEQMALALNEGYAIEITPVRIPGTSRVNIALRIYEFDPPNPFHIRQSAYQINAEALYRNGLESEFAHILDKLRAYVKRLP